MKFADLFAQGRGRLARAGIADAALDARLLLAHCSGLDTAALIGVQGEEVSGDLAERFTGAIDRRLAAEPVSRIVGFREFFGLAFEISAATLDPRPETEMLVERALADFPDPQAELRFADVGTGSGAIAIAILKHRPRARGIGIDILPQALEIARRNARRHGVEARFHAVEGSVLNGVAGSLDFIVANPPYIRSDEMAGLPAEVRLYEPIAALEAGPEGMAVIAAVIEGSHRCLRAGGRLYLEFGLNQADAVADCARARGLDEIEIAADLSGRPRMLAATRR